MSEWLVNFLLGNRHFQAPTRFVLGVAEVLCSKGLPIWVFGVWRQSGVQVCAEHMHNDLNIQNMNQSDWSRVSYLFHGQIQVLFKGNVNCIVIQIHLLAKVLQTPGWRTLNEQCFLLSMCIWLEFQPFTSKSFQGLKSLKIKIIQALQRILSTHTLIIWWYRKLCCYWTMFEML